jgi:hypothetical protein
VSTERQIRAFVRRQRREHDSRRLSDRLIDIYTWMLGAVVASVVLSGLVDGGIAPHPQVFMDTIAWLPVVLLVAMWAVLRFGTWQGPVLFSEPELQWVVSSPLDRRTLILAKLKRATVIAIGVGVVGGIAVAIGAAAMAHHNVLLLFVVATLSLSLISAMSTALAWHIERSKSWSRVIEVGTPVMVAAVGVVSVLVMNSRTTAAAWSGPWGWATAPIGAAAGASVGGWVIVTALFLVSTVAAVMSAAATAQMISDEELWRRSEARSSASAALFFGNVRAATTIARRQRARGHMRGRTLRMVRLGNPWLTIPARDLLTLRRNQRLLVVSGGFVAVAFVSGVAAATRPALLVGVFVGLYAAASRLMEPIRLESDRTDAHRMLPWPWGTILVLHCAVPTVALTVLVWIGLSVVGITGLAPSAATVLLAVLAPFVASALVLSAGVAASRSGFPVEMLISGTQQSSFMLVLWMITGPMLALIALGIAAGTVLPHLGEGIGQSTFTAVLFLTMATAAFGAWLWNRKPKPE